TRIFDEVAQVAVFFLADRRLQRHGLLAHLLDLPDPFRRISERRIGLAGFGHAPGDLFACRFAAVLLHEAPAYADELVDGFHHVDGDADGACLVGDGAGNRLPDPPRCVGRELEALAVVELLDGPDEADVPFL